jgi:hypothetical protein
MGTTESDGNGTTHFFDINGGKALAFKPKSLTDPEAQAVLVYYHGYNSSNDLKSYMASFPTERDLRPLLAATPMLLVEPWGGQKSDFSKFVTASGLTALIDEAIRLAGIKGPPSRVILAAHSGGGMQLPLAAESSFAYADQVTQVWALDCMYLSEGTRWISWCRKNAGKTLRVRASTHPLSAKPRREAEAIEQAAGGGLLLNANAAIVDLKHELFPPTYVPAFSRFRSDILGRAVLPIERQRASIEQQRR